VDVDLAGRIIRLNAVDQDEDPEGEPTLVERRALHFDRGLRVAGTDLRNRVAVGFRLDSQPSVEGDADGERARTDFRGSR
jgi:hypothetical protein